MSYIGTKPADQVLDSNLIADGTITSSKIADASIVNADIANSTIALAKLSATGTPSSSNYLRGDNTWASVAASQWTTTGSDIYYTTGNVGIGTASPGAKLQVQGSGGGQVFIDNASGGSNYYDATNHYFRGTSGSGNRMTLDSAGNLQFNSGYGSVATAYGCRAWVNWNGTGTVAIRSSGNVSSISDNGTGDYTINYSNSMPDGNYSIVGFCRSDNDGNPAANISMGSSYSPGTGSARVMTGVSNSKIDFAVICAAVFR